MKATAHYMAAYLLALYQCSKKGQNKQGDVVRFALRHYINGFSKDAFNLVNDGKMSAAEKQLRFACSNADKHDYTVSLGGGCHALTQKVIDQLDLAAGEACDYEGLQHSNILNVSNWFDDYIAATRPTKKATKRSGSSKKEGKASTSDRYMAAYLMALKMQGGTFNMPVQLQTAIQYAMTELVSNACPDANTMVNGGKMTSAEKSLAFAASNADKMGYTVAPSRGYHRLTNEGEAFLRKVRNNESAYDGGGNLTLTNGFFYKLEDNVERFSSDDMDW